MEPDTKETVLNTTKAESETNVPNTVHQEPILLSSKEKMLTSIIVYISHTYPQLSQLHEEIVKSCCRSEQNLESLLSSLEILNGCLIRELVYGPSHSHSPVSELPALIHQDMQFRHYAPPTTYLSQD